MSVSVRVHNFCVCPEEETPSSALPPPPAVPTLYLLRKMQL